MCSTGSEPDVYFVDDPKKKLAIIPLLENEFKNVEGLAADIIKNEPRLRSPLQDSLQVRNPLRFRL